jgi:hypothetical protein
MNESVKTIYGLANQIEEGFSKVTRQQLLNITKKLQIAISVERDI